MRIKPTASGRLWLVLAAGLSQLLPVNVSSAATDNSLLVYFGTYTGPSSQGIYVSRFNPRDGSLTAPELAVATRNPSFLALHPNHRFLFAVGETDKFRGKPSGEVSAFAIEKTGKLTLINQQSSGGSGPCHLALDRNGQCLLVANYGSGSVAALPVNKNGSLGVAEAVTQHRGSSLHPQRQAGPHAHFITPDPANRLAFACDLGLDQVLIYQLDPRKALLTCAEPAFGRLPPGSGPRHLVFSRKGDFVYVINELNSTVTAFSRATKTGQLEEIQTVSSLPADFGGGNSCAEIQMHPSGKFLYASNRGHDSIALFAIDKRSGKLAPLGHQATQGKTPRHFALDDSGRWLLAENQDSDNVLVLRVDGQTGLLAPVGAPVEVPSPVCAVFR